MKVDTTTKSKGNYAALCHTIQVSEMKSKTLSRRLGTAEILLCIHRLLFHIYPHLRAICGDFYPAIFIRAQQ